MPRKRSPDSTSDRQRIQFAYNADCAKPIGEVFKYLLKSDTLPSRKGKHKGLDAMIAFWLPFALKEKAGVSDEEKVAIACDAIDSLNQHIDLIRETFGIEAPIPVVDPVQLKQDMRAVATEVVQEFVANGAMLTPTNKPAITHTPNAALIQTVSQSASNGSSPNNEEGVDFDEEALLGGLFDETGISE